MGSLDDFSLELHKLAVSPCVKFHLRKIITVELHHFLDGFSLAYGAVSYLRTIDTKGKVGCNSVIGKGYIAKKREQWPN